MNTIESTTTKDDKKIVQAKEGQKDKKVQNKGAKTSDQLTLDDQKK